MTALLQGVCFSMPLCNAEEEQVTDDDLMEFSKIQTLNLGQLPFSSSTFPLFASQAAVTDSSSFIFLELADTSYRCFI